MIKIINLEDCCGCSACSQKCPNQCITMIEDSEGFPYPKVNMQLCSDCGLCELVCPIHNKNDVKKPIKVLAAYNKDMVVRLKSSSGGIFAFLAEKTIEEGGIVFGARFNKNWQVNLDYAKTLNGISAFMGSKYVQAIVGNAFGNAKLFLEQGRQVLFTGTPCQIASLKTFLKKDYDNLYTIDIICHGVPSPLVWRKYLSEIISKSRVVSVSFRDKTIGWSKFCLCVKTENDTKQYIEDHHKDPYMQLFLRNVILRPSCYKCSFRCGKSGSDITMADFWGIQEVLPGYSDDKGVSLVMLNTEKGLGLLNRNDFECKEVDYDEVIHFNMAWYQSYAIPENRELFFSEIKRKSVHKLYRKMFEPEKLLKNRIKRKLRSFLKAE